jgi:isoquinoline 1-oxidoreductase beta subunit
MSTARRDLLVQAGAAGGGFLLGLSLPGRAASGAGARFVPNAWIRIGADDSVTLMLSQVEIGQGIATTLPAVLADELGADWNRVAVENAPVDEAYRNPAFRWMFTGNSESTATFAPIMRRAGAAARAMLVGAAAEGWSVPDAECRSEGGAVLHVPSGRRVSFGSLAAAAARRPVPTDPPLRPDAELRLVGRPLARRDIPAKVDGSAVFGLDVVLPGLAVAAVRHAPMLGGGLARFDPASIAGRPGVIGAFPIPNGVAVVAERFWQAVAALGALDVTWTDGDAAIATPALEALHAAALEAGPWVTVEERGTPAGPAVPRVIRDYRSPFQAHAPMEPMNCTARVTAEGCEVWAPTQGQDAVRAAVAGALDLPAETVTVKWTYAGGGFGRRLLADYAVQAALLSRAVGRPVKAVWTREEDFARDLYRPMTLTRLVAALGPDGLPAEISARLVSATQLGGVFPAAVQGGRDPRVVEGLETTRYAVARWRLDYRMVDLGALPTSVLRTTGFGPNVFALECFVDELAATSGRDPYDYRRALLAHDARALAVLDAAARRAGWGTPLPEGVGRGIAFAEAFGTLLAQVVELAVEPGRQIRLRRVVTAADPGRVYDPGIAASNIEGGVVWGLSTALKGEITFADGRAEQSNFDGYDLMHLWEMPPRIETVLIEGDRDGAIGGLGESGPVCIPPALAGAIFAVTGERLRDLPVTRAGYAIAA